MTPMKWSLPVNLSKLSNEPWPKAPEEWELDYIETLDGSERETCLCSHFPIKRVCHIRNKLNNHTTIVGKCCITKIGKTFEKFQSISSIFSSLLKITDNIEATASKKLIKYAYRKKIINKWEYDFCFDVFKKKNYSVAQLNTKVKINQKIIKGISSKKLEVTEKKVQDIVAKTIPEAFAALKKNPKIMPDKLLIDFCFEKGYILSQDKFFLISLMEKNIQKLSIKQQKWLNDIKQKILMNFKE